MTSERTAATVLQEYLALQKHIAEKETAQERKLDALLEERSLLLGPLIGPHLMQQERRMEYTPFSLSHQRVWSQECLLQASRTPGVLLLGEKFWYEGWEYTIDGYYDNYPTCYYTVRGVRYTNPENTHAMC